VFNKKDKSGVSLPAVKEVCGYEIRKMPIAPYLAAIEKLTSLPEDFMAACFPGKSPSEILDSLTAITADSLAELITGACVAAPKYVIALVSELTGIDGDELMNNPKIGPDGLIEIISAFIEVNRLGECVSGVRALKARLTGLTKGI